MKTKEQELKNRKQAKEVNKIYEKLNKKEMGVLMGWISDNCDIAVENYKQEATQEIIEVINEILENMPKRYIDRRKDGSGTIVLINMDEFRKELRQKLQNKEKK